MRRGIAVALIAAAVAVLCTAIAGAHRASYATFVKEDNATSPSEPPTKITGHLESPKHACVRGRTVKLLVRTEDGSTVLLDQDVSSDRGKWTLSGDLTSTHGERIKVAEKRLRKRHGHRRVCLADSIPVAF
jgi:hypothetical protein